MWNSFNQLLWSAALARIDFFPLLLMIILNSFPATR
jgi:hypothetical protein